ncbi:MAG: hypothetical protein B6I28_01735 [Fusobacteriia bacterium 4572_132]|nr:MAG: hypothetical protein B6I28_01735 [Fusobacteriia bacterium 4572_132]
MNKNKEKIKGKSNKVNYEMKNKKKIMEILTNKFYLSFSSLNEVLEILWELEEFKKVNIIDFLEGLNYSDNYSKKQKGNRLLKELREKKYPEMTESLLKIKKEIKEIEKGKKSLKLEIPQNLEGDFLKLEIIVKKEQEIDEIINKLFEKKQALKNILRKIQRGG